MAAANEFLTEHKAVGGDRLKLTTQERLLILWLREEGVNAADVMKRFSEEELPASKVVLAEGILDYLKSQKENDRYHLYSIRSKLFEVSNCLY